MDGKIFLATFGAVFMAELADKTQLVGIGMTAKSGKPLSVWLGSVSAYMIVTVVSVLIGAALGKFIRPEYIRYAGAALFILVGILLFIGKL
jgi:putative Ca2+/H+ antiporter (TMEM165/GDT1 family)